jgi:large subunit ribosomal protein L7A
MIELPVIWQLPQSMEDLVTYLLASGERKAVGIKQTLRALTQGRALQVYLALDADPLLVEDIAKEAENRSILIVRVPAMKELGKLCGIQVPAAAAALITG